MTALHMRLDCSRSLKVIDFYTVQKPIYDFLLVISCDLGSILHHFFRFCEEKFKTTSP